MMNYRIKSRLKKTARLLNLPSTRSRTGAILPLFAVMLPVLLLLAMIAIELAGLQLTRTQLKVATDAAARAGGRAWSLSHDRQQAVEHAQIAALANNVGGQGLLLEDTDIVFGNASRPDFGRYQFSENKGSSPNNLITGIRVDGEFPRNLIFRVAGIESVNLSVSSVTAQVDRDIALVVDRSGSMAYFYDEEFLFNTITEIFNNNQSTISDKEYDDAVADFQGIPRLAAMSLRRRRYPDSVLQHLTGDLREYAETLNTEYRNLSRAPRQSRWAVLEVATEVFFDTIKSTPVDEIISIASFERNATLDLPLTSDLSLAQQAVEQLVPNGGTSIGRGIQQAIGELAANRREGAIPTILVFTDGVNNAGPNPIQVAKNAARDFPGLVINTVTFADGDPTIMAEIARIGHGLHYHANDGEELREIFREIAESFSTVIIE